MAKYCVKACPNCKFYRQKKTEDGITQNCTKNNIRIMEDFLCEQEILQWIWNATSQIIELLKWNSVMRTLITLWKNSVLC